MPATDRRARVFIGRVSGYDDRDGIQDVVRRGLEALGVERLGPDVFAKANWVTPHREVASACYTRPEVVRGALDVLTERFDDSHWTFGGNSGRGFPTHVALKWAVGPAQPEVAGDGYAALPRLFPGRVEMRPTDENRLLRYGLSHGPRLTDAARTLPLWGRQPELRFWDEIETDARLFDADSVVVFPKLKTNVLSGAITAAVKLTGIGLLIDRHRLTGHNFHNDRRIADMQEITDPNLIITDAIECAWGGNQMTEPGKALGVIIMATNSVAHDATCARIFGHDPHKVEHLWLTSERGYGSLDAIEVVGDATVEELRAVTATWGHHGLLPVEEFGDRYADEVGEPFPWQVLAGPPRDEAGSNGVLLDWLYMSYDHPEFRARMKRWPALSVCVGQFEGFPENKRVVLFGDRAIEQWRKLGELRERPFYWVPRWLRKLTGGASRMAHFRHPNGKTGRVCYIPGDPPGHKDALVGFFLFSLGAVRASLMRVDFVAVSYISMIPTLLRAWWRNRSGVLRVEASDIQRLKGRRALAPPVRSPVAVGAEAEIVPAGISDPT